MDAVELTFPVDVATAPKLMGSEGFARPTHSNSIDCCNSSPLIQNGWSLIILLPILLVSFHFFPLCFNPYLFFLHESASIALWFWDFSVRYSVV